MIALYLVKPKAADKRELLFNKHACGAGLSNKSSCLATTLGGMKLTKSGDMIFAALCCATYARLKCSTNPLRFCPVCQRLQISPSWENNLILHQLASILFIYFLHF
jgi:hypothetical protein